MLRIATRGSALALAQSRLVGGWLERDGERVELLVRKTKGDAIVDRPFRQMEGKGFFTKELEDALLAGEADAAVHSMKDLPTELPAGLVVGAVAEREDPADCLLVRRERADARFALPVAPGARVGTTSTRRRAQWIARRPDTTLADLRGNVPTRVEKLRRGEYDAIVLAKAGLDRLRLDLSDLAVTRLDPAEFVCAPAQGALAIEVRGGDPGAECVARLDRADVRAAVEAERAVLSALGGGCSQPVGAYARKRGRTFVLDAVLGPQEEGAAPLRRARVEAEHFEAAVRVAVAALGSAASEAPMHLRGRTIALTAQSGRSGRLARELEERGARVWLAPLIEMARVDAPESGRAIEEIGAFDAVLFTSRTAAEALLERLSPGALAALGAGPILGAVGRATAEPLEDAGLEVAIVGDGSGGAALAALAVVALRGRRARVLLPAAREPRPELAQALERAGHAVTHAPLYATASAGAASLEAFRGETVDAAVFASPSAVRAFAALRPFEMRDAIAIGAATLAALRDAGLNARVAASPDPVSVAEALR